jgi:DoxX-like family
MACYPFGMGARPGIYVETLIHADVEQVWQRTQNPDWHEPWDLRFTSIRYLPRPSATAPQLFEYKTRIGFGIEISGKGESTGSREEETGRRTSALKFWSDDSKSLIRDGSGYWQYIPIKDGTRFLTWYDYRTRFGRFGKVIDRFCFRPLLGWATAWSFDRLRLQIEKHTDSPSALRLSAIHACSRISIAFIWLWQGVVPKLLFDNADERAMLAAAHLPARLVAPMGIAELVIAACSILLWRNRMFFVLNILAMVMALVAVSISSPHYVGAAFNPVTLNLAVIALSTIGLVAISAAPSAARCLRKPPEEPR